MLDLWLFQKQVPLEEKKLFALLDKLNLSQFYRRMIRLGECWMEGTPCPEELKPVQDYILQSGVYGTEEHRVLAQSAQAESKGKHLLLRFCPPLKEMRYHFPVLQRLPCCCPSAGWPLGAGAEKGHRQIPAGGGSAENPFPGGNGRKP